MPITIISSLPEPRERCSRSARVLRYPSPWHVFGVQAVAAGGCWLAPEVSFTILILGGCSSSSALTRRLGCQLIAAPLNLLLLRRQLCPCHQSLGYQLLGYLLGPRTCRQGQLII